MASLEHPSFASLPALKEQGGRTQLIVDGKPFLILGGELANSSPSSLAQLAPAWARFQKMHLNTVVAPVSWELIEPVEGRFDFSSVDGLIQQARGHGMRLVLLWFGSWKNGDESHQGRHLRIPPDGFGIQRLKLYRYQ